MNTTYDRKSHQRIIKNLRVFKAFSYDVIDLFYGIKERLEGERNDARAMADRLAEIVEEGLEGMDEDDHPFVEKARKALQAWREARNE